MPLLIVDSGPIDCQDKTRSHPSVSSPIPPPWTLQFYPPPRPVITELGQSVCWPVGGPGSRNGQRVPYFSEPWGWDRRRPPQPPYPRRVGVGVAVRAKTKWRKGRGKAQGASCTIKKKGELSFSTAFRGVKRVPRIGASAVTLCTWLSRSSPFLPRERKGEKMRKCTLASSLGSTSLEIARRKLSRRGWQTFRTVKRVVGDESRRGSGF